MKKHKHKHKGIQKSLFVINQFEECMGPGISIAASKGIEIPKSQIDAICIRCRNDTCERAGRGTTTWTERMSTQVEYLLSDPIFSELASQFHKEIAQLDVKNLKQEIESITLNTKGSAGSGWENADQKTLKPDSVVVRPLPNLIIPAKPDPKIIAPKTPSSPIIKRNTPLPSGGIMVGGNNSAPPIDPWANADKNRVVKPGATITLPPKKETKE